MSTRNEHRACGRGEGDCQVVIGMKKGAFVSCSEPAAIEINYGYSGEILKMCYRHYEANRDRDEPTIEELRKQMEDGYIPAADAALELDEEN